MGDRRKSEGPQEKRQASAHRGGTGMWSESQWTRSSICRTSHPYLLPSCTARPCFAIASKPQRMADNDVFDSVQWDSETQSPPTMVDYPTSSGSAGTGYNVTHEDGDSAAVKWEGYLTPVVSDPIKELEGTKDMYVSYRVSAKVRPNLRSNDMHFLSLITFLSYATDQLTHLYYTQSNHSTALPGLHFLEGASG